MQKGEREITIRNEEPGVLTLIAWTSLVAVIAIIGGIQIVSFLKSADMDVRIYYDAALALRNGEDMFAAWDDSHPLTYIYPPLLAILFMPLTLIPLEQAAAVWTLVNMGLLAACLWLGATETIRRFKSRTDAATLPVVMLVGTLLFLPRIKAEFDQGQVDFLVLAFVLLALRFIARRPVLAGVLLGVAANIKYQTVIFLPYFLIRGWWSASAGLVGGAIGCALSGSLVIGWALNLDYLRRAFSGLGSMLGLEPSGEPLPFIFPMAWTESVSLSSTFARWSAQAGSGDTGTFVLILLAALACLGLGWWCYASAGQPLLKGRQGTSARQAVEQQPLVALEWAGLLVATIAFSPQTKMRHIALLLFLAVLIAHFLVMGRRAVPRWPLLVATVIMLLGMILPPGETENLRAMRKSWRAEGGPSWCLLLAYFTMLWTALRWLRSPAPVVSGALDEPVDQEG